MCNVLYCLKFLVTFVYNFITVTVKGIIQGGAQLLSSGFEIVTIRPSTKRRIKRQTAFHSVKAQINILRGH